MPTLDELRKRFSRDPETAKPAPTQEGVTAAAKSVAPSSAVGATTECIVWSDDMVKRWAPKFDVISKGRDSTGVQVIDLRFKFGKNTGKTMKDMGAASGAGRGYLRWFYCETGMDECVRAVIRFALGENDETITSKYNAVEKGAR